MQLIISKASFPIFFSGYLSNKELTRMLTRVSKMFSYKPTGTPRRIHVDSTCILRRYVEDQLWTNFRVISTKFFYVISLIEKSPSFPHTFFDVISMVEKSTLFPHTFFHVISMVEKSMLFPGTFFDVISMVEQSTSQPRIFFDVIFLVEISTTFLLIFFNLILMVKKSTLFALTFFDEILMYSTSFFVSCKLMKTFEGVFLF